MKTTGNFLYHKWFWLTMMFDPRKLLLNCPFTAPRLLQNSIIPAFWAAPKHSSPLPPLSVSMNTILPISLFYSFYRHNICIIGSPVYLYLIHPLCPKPVHTLDCGIHHYAPVVGQTCHSWMRIHIFLHFLWCTCLYPGERHLPTALVPASEQCQKQESGI